MSLAARDSLMSLRDVACTGQRRSSRHHSKNSASVVTDDESNNNMNDSCHRKRRKLPLQDLQERVAAKRRQLSPTTTTTTRPTAYTKKTVSFDLHKNQISQRHLTDTDLSEAWMTAADFCDIQKSCNLDGGGLSTGPIHDDSHDNLHDNHHDTTTRRGGGSPHSGPGTSGPTCRGHQGTHTSQQAVSDLVTGTARPISTTQQQQQ